MVVVVVVVVPNVVDVMDGQINGAQANAQLTSGALLRLLRAPGAPDGALAARRGDPALLVSAWQRPDSGYKGLLSAPVCRLLACARLDSIG